MTGKRRCAWFESAVLGALAASAFPCSRQAQATPYKGDVRPNDPEIHSEMSAPESKDGSIILVTVKVPAALKGKTITGEFENIELPFFPEGPEGNEYEAVLGVPYEHVPGPASVKIHVGDPPDVHQSEADFKIVPGQYTTESIKVDNRRVQPTNPKDLARIHRESQLIGRVYSVVTPMKYWDGPFGLPVPRIRYTSNFGARRTYNGVKKSPHLGLDFKAPTGTPIRAPAPGKVLLAKNLFFTGNTVILDHGYGVLTLYAHMSRMKSKVGQTVKKGQVLGLAGMTGRVTGPHLHWMAIIHKEKVNPLDLTQVMR